jgi:hypothetical protein
LKEEDAQLDEILAKGSLGGPQYDRIFERVLERTATDKPAVSKAPRRWIAIPGAALAAGLAFWLVLAGFRGSGEFTPKGLPVAATGAIEIGCTPSGPRVCRLGETLVFTVNAAIAPGYLGAYAERLGDPSGERIWYFPNSAGSSPVIPRGEGTVVVLDGIQIGNEHSPGDYRVTAWIATRPIQRSEIGNLEAADVFVSRSILDVKIVHQR